jgi:hypothetical protein
MNEPKKDRFSQESNAWTHPSLNPTVERNSAYIPGNPDFDPSRDVPQARGCDTTFDIISSIP